MFKFNKIDYLTDGLLDLVIERKARAWKRKGYLPAYIYGIYLHNDDEMIGRIDIRIGSNENTKYGGNIGYRIDEKFRGGGFAAKACIIIKKVAEAHNMDKLIITCNPDNIPSRKTCEKLGAEFIEIIDLPKNHEMYKRGERKKCVYEWKI